MSKKDQILNVFVALTAISSLGFLISTMVLLMLANLWAQESTINLSWVWNIPFGFMLTALIGFSGGIITFFSVSTNCKEEKKNVE